MLNTRTAIAVIAIALLSTPFARISAQSIQNHPAPWFGEPGRSFFFQLDTPGKQLFVNRSTSTGGEELVQVPVAGGTTQVWFANKRSEIQDRMSVSGDGKTVAFARGTESRVYVLASPASSPVTAANVAPDRDPRQLVLSRDGRWIAFSAFGVEDGGPIGRAQTNLYVAATDGSVAYRITKTPISGRYITFALSADGATLVWVDDPTKGPIVSNRDGGGFTRLPAPGARIERVFSSADGNRIYCSTVEAKAVKLHSIPRAGSIWNLEDEAQSGKFAVSREGNAIRWFQAPTRYSPGSCWSVTGKSSRTSMFTFTRPRYSGSMVMSGDGQIVVWREGLHTRIWKAGL